MVVATVAPLALMLGPAIFAGLGVTNSILITQGSKIGYVWHVFWCRMSLIIGYKNTHPVKLAYMICKFAVEFGEDKKHTIRMDIDKQLLFVLGHPLCPIRDFFFDKNGKLKRNYVYVPSNSFHFRTKPNANGSTYKIKAIPMKTADGLVVGFKFWTKGFWFCNKSAKIERNNTINNHYMDFRDSSGKSGMDEVIEILGNLNDPRYKTIFDNFHKSIKTHQIDLHYYQYNGVPLENGSTPPRPRPANGSNGYGTVSPPRPQSQMRQRKKKTKKDNE